jgi:hypothetical protein
VAGLLGHQCQQQQFQVAGGEYAGAAALVAVEAVTAAAEFLGSVFSHFLFALGH